MSNDKNYHRPYKNCYDAVNEVASGEKSCCEEPSQTIQGETHTVRELLKKHQAGQVIRNKPVIHLDAEIEKINRFHRRDLDLTDLQELSRHNSEMRKKINSAIAEKKEQEKEAERQKKIDQEVEKKLAEKQDKEKKKEDE